MRKVGDFVGAIEPIQPTGKKNEETIHMDQIESDIAILGAITSLYEQQDFQKDFKNVEEKITLEIEKILKDNAERFGLSATHSVHTDQYYHVVSRLKKPKSLLDKFVRKSSGLDLITSHSLADAEDVKAKSEAIIKSLKHFDDIIGLRIVTELQLDCIQVHKLLVDHQAQLNEKHITFKDLSAQPTRMKNGLNIYNIKGEYLNEYGFELQVKSKINSAWGDIDHSLFYKDYSISPIKDTVQVSINRIGMLLDELEKFLFDLRKSNNDYERKAERNKFLQRLDEELSAQLKDKLGIPYDIAKIAEPLFHFYKALGGNEARLALLDYTILQYVCADDAKNKYTGIRRNDFELMLFELIYFGWRRLFQAVEINQGNYEANLDVYFSDVLQLNTDRVIASGVSLDQESVKTFVQSLFTTLLRYSKSTKTVLGYAEYSRAFRIYSFLLENLEDSEENHPGILEAFKNLYSLLVFSDDAKDYLATVVQTFSEDIVKDTAYQINSIAEKREPQDKVNSTMLKEIMKISGNIVETFKPNEGQ